jgi:hypothetical protein
MNETTTQQTAHKVFIICMHTVSDVYSAPCVSINSTNLHGMKMERTLVSKVFVILCKKKKCCKNIAKKYFIMPVYITDKTMNGMQILE